VIDKYSAPEPSSRVNIDAEYFAAPALKPKSKRDAPDLPEVVAEAVALEGKESLIKEDDINATATRGIAGKSCLDIAFKLRREGGKFGEEIPEELAKLRSILPELLRAGGCTRKLNSKLPDRRRCFTGRPRKKRKTRPEERLRFLKGDKLLVKGGHTAVSRVC